MRMLHVQIAMFSVTYPQRILCFCYLETTLGQTYYYLKRLRELSPRTLIQIETTCISYGAATIGMRWLHDSVNFYV